MRRIFTAVAFLASVACSSSDQQKAKENAHADLRKAEQATKKAGKEIQKDVQKLNEQLGSVAQPDTKSASEKISEATTAAKAAAARAGVQLDRATLLGRVKAKLASDAGLSTASSVDVSVAGSVVTLSGSVATENQKRTAEAAASQVDGVSKVRNDLTVRP